MTRSIHQPPRQIQLLSLLPPLVLGLAACGTSPLSGSATEVISRVELTFTPDGGGAPVVAAFTDPDGDGGVSGVAEDIALALGTSYTLEIALSNELVDPPVDITGEIQDDAEEHMFFLIGDAVSGPASASDSARVTQDYADLESDYGPNHVGEDLPVGLVHTINATSTGDGQLRVMLRHLPALNGEPQKSADLPGDLADGDVLPGEVDVDVRFDLSVQ